MAGGIEQMKEARLEEEQEEQQQKAMEEAMEGAERWAVGREARSRQAAEDLPKARGATIRATRPTKRQLEQRQEAAGGSERRRRRKRTSTRASGGTSSERLPGGASIERSACRAESRAAS